MSETCDQILESSRFDSIRIKSNRLCWKSLSQKQSQSCKRETSVLCFEFNKFVLFLFLPVLDVNGSLISSNDPVLLAHQNCPIRWRLSGGPCLRGRTGPTEICHQPAKGKYF